MTAPIPMSPLVPPARSPARRCVRHDTREAAGRCMVCEGGFCRECIPVHFVRFFCGPCFAGGTPAAASAARPSRKRLRALVLTTGSLFFLIGGFYLLGRVLAAVPPNFHDGTIWREGSGR